jgi:hypothetical protein
MQPGRSRLPTCFRRFPGAVLQLSPEGVVLGSNGRLERELGRSLMGRPFAEVLDPDSSARKWARILADAPGLPDEENAAWELILRGVDTLPEPRPFSVLWDAEAEVIWLLEHRPDPRLDTLREQVTEVNSELANAQRELVKERARLAHALAELGEQHRETQRLSGILQEQNEELEAQNEELLATTEELT